MGHSAVTVKSEVVTPHNRKHHPSFPDRFGELEDARAWCAPFFNWYNHQHHHSGLGWMTPLKFQYWMRDPPGGGALFNTTSAYSIEFFP